jgi:predicted CopG family antitoxin
MEKMTETNTTTITIPSELRDRLRARKIGNDTYSDVIERLLADTDE